MTNSALATTQDDFLGGRLTLTQPATGYRAGVDPVFLASFVNAEPGESVLELGCGVGAAALCLGTRVSGLRLVGVERQTQYAEFADENAQENDIDFTVHNCDLMDMPAELKDENFDHVIMNPPYYQRTRGSSSPDAAREQALGEGTPLKDWMDHATRRLKPRGYVTLIQAAERLPDVLGAMDDRLGSVLVKPLTPRVGHAAKLVLVHARKGGRGAFRLAAPLVLHQGAAHEEDKDHYTPEVSAILRDGHALPLW